MVKEKFNVDRVWSYSRLSNFVDTPWVYRMTYLDPRRIRCSNVYTVFGTKFHDLIQDFQEGKTTRDEMAKGFEDRILEWRMDSNSLKFMSEKVENGYINNLRHYFENTDKIPYEVTNEKPVCIHLKRPNGGNVVFVGYIDSIYTDGDITYIMDYKTSSKGDYTGKKLKAHSKQLQLYAIGIHQQFGIPYDKINLRFDMMKYIKISFLQKNGKWKDSLQERSQWVASQEKKIRKLLSDEGVDLFKIDELVGHANIENTLESLPDYVQDHFKITNAYIDTEISDDIAKEIEAFAVSNVMECERKEAGDWEVEFPEPEIDESNRFFYEVLSPQVLEFHKGYQEEQAVKRARKSRDEEIDELAALFE